MSTQTEHERVRRGWRVADKLWERIEPLLPPGKPHPLGCHNPRVSERAMFRKRKTWSERTIYANLLWWLAQTTSSQSHKTT